MKNKGFIVIELFIVLTMIGILTAITLPVFLDYKEDKRDSTIIQINYKDTTQKSGPIR